MHVCKRHSVGKNTHALGRSRGCSPGSLSWGPRSKAHTGAESWWGGGGSAGRGGTWECEHQAIVKHWPGTSLSGQVRRPELPLGTRRLQTRAAAPRSVRPPAAAAGPLPAPTGQGLRQLLLPPSRWAHENRTLNSFI